tara:strand:- start:406 stop:534 length:129 start_codon:yes stop_codon:yes gene_type:complete
MDIDLMTLALPAERLGLCILQKSLQPLRKQKDRDSPGEINGP